MIDPEEHHDYKWCSLEEILKEEDLLWGVPTTLHDFGIMPDLGTDYTLRDGSRVVFLG